MFKEIPTEKEAREKLISNYQPSEAEREITSAVLNEFQRSRNLQNRARNEFDGRSLLQEISSQKKSFNSYVPPLSEDPDENWRAQTIRPITRNKIISIAAHVTATILYPYFYAQNETDDDDKEAAMIMKDLVEWVIENSNYKRKFIQGVITALMSPAMIMSEEFSEVMRKIKEVQADGSWTKKEVVDEILSGFIFNIVSAQELLIANIKEPNIQKQRYVMRARYIDYLEAKQIYKDRPNIDFVKQGVMRVFNEEDGTFYDVQDEDAKGHMVYEVKYYNRSQDLELVFLNGVLVDHPEQPNRRIDKRYPFAKGFFEPISDGQFFYGKSAVSKLASDQEVVDTLYNMVLDGTYLQLMPPMALYGDEMVDSSVTVPGMITSFENPDSELKTILPRSDVRGGMQAISMVEQSMAESSQDNFRSGIGDTGGETARGVLVKEQNARIQLGLFGKMIGFVVEDLGDLITGDILQHMSVGDASDITDRLKFKKFVLRDKIENGKKVNKEIRFAIDPFLKEDSNVFAESLDLLQEEGGFDPNKKIAVVNPSVFRNLKFSAHSNPEELTPKSKALEKALNLEAYDRAILNPTVDQESVTRDFLLEVYKPGDSDKYIRKAQPQSAVPSPFTGGEEESGIQGPKIGQPNSNLVGQLTGSNSLGVAASSDF